MWSESCRVFLLLPLLVVFALGEVSQNFVYLSVPSPSCNKRNKHRSKYSCSCPPPQLNKKKPWYRRIKWKPRSVRLSFFVQKIYLFMFLLDI
jgi:hypothetical protein